MEGFNWY